MENIAILDRLRALFTRQGASAPHERRTGQLIPFARKRAPLPVAFALQGGGAHGAFTWGVLDRALEAGLAFEAISGTSAGAINAAVLASAHAQGGAPYARTRLGAFWQALAQVARLNPLRPTTLEAVAFGRDLELSATAIMRDMLSRVVSPYQFNPLDVNPLRQILGEFVDVEALRTPNATRLLVAATNAETGAARLFTNEEITLDVLLASACLPQLSQAVKLDDGYYWDGGYTSNPPLVPLIERTSAKEVVLVRLSPASDRGLPVTAPKIQTRLNRIVFDAPLKRELDELDRLRRVTAESGAHRTTLGRRLEAMRLHTIGEDDLMNEVGAASQGHPDARLIDLLHREGRASCERWLAAGFAETIPKQRLAMNFLA